MREHSSNVNDLDRCAWEAICGWPIAAGFDPVHGGLNFGDLTRSFLWDKVGRSVRNEPHGTKFFYNNGQGGAEDNGRKRTTGVFGELRRRVGQRFAHLSFGLQGGRRQLRTGRPVFVPKLSSRILRAVGRELLVNPDVNVVTQSRPEGMTPKDNLLIVPYPPRKTSASGSIAGRLVEAAVYGLGKKGITLLDSDIDLFRRQVIVLEERLSLERGYMEMLRPSCVVVHADNHPPHQGYVELARLAGIPSIMVQHGLDCERYYLDDAYADHIAVWGNERKQRYITRSRPGWREISVTGNPAYDSLQPAGCNTLKGKYWLWATRPHTEEKCYAPSRKPEEGLLILRALIEQLRKDPAVRLTVKPHPWDYRRLYDEIVASSGLSNRITVSQMKLDDLLPEASIVFSEDSTAGLDAMLHGKPLVHLHFAESEPVMPFAKYGAAVLVRSAEELADAVRNCPDNHSMREKQKAFIEDFAGPHDGGSAKRVVEVILATI